ncbi:MAG: hypothetical protein AAGC91_08075 [Pseudomonadota bacterium]
MSNPGLKRLMSVAATVSLVTLPITADAARAFLTGAKVIEVRSFGAGNFGSCVAQIDQNVNADGDRSLSCGNQFLVSFGCDGESTNSRSEAQLMYNTAQLALVTGNVVDVLVNDGERYNGTLCVAEAILVKSN